MNNNIKVAVIDMNNGFPNQGMRGILQILHQYRDHNQLELEIDIFDIRQKNEVPNLDYNIYISSGGPGSPFDGKDQIWENDFFDLLDRIDHYNLHHEDKKHAFLICHSFQLACRKYGLGQVAPRKSSALGIFPITLTTEGQKEPIFDGLPHPFYAVDSRDWQVIQPNEKAFEKMGAQLLAIEKERPHINLERCIMAIRFSPYVIGTQFHPEADPIGMKAHLSIDEKKQGIIKAHGKKKYEDMLSSLENPDRIILTQRIILPNFLNQAINALHLA